MEVEEVLAQGETVIARPPSQVAVALDQLIAVYYDHSLFYLSKEMWRTAIALAIQQPEAHFSKVYTGLDARLCQQVCRLIRRLQHAGLVRPEIDADAVGAMIFNNLNLMFIEFVKDDAMALDTLKQCVARQNAPLAGLIALQ